MSEIAVTCLVDHDGRGARFTGHSLIGGEVVDCERSATFRERDWPGGRPPTFTVTFSNGTVIEGEVAPGWPQRRCVDWVCEGR